MPGFVDIAIVRSLIKAETAPFRFPTHLTFQETRGQWLFHSVNRSGTLFDTSEQGRSLTNTGSVTFATDDYLPHGILNGSSQYFTRTDEAGLRVTDALTLISVPNFDAAPGAFEPIAGKWRTTTANRSFLLSRNVSGNAVANVSVDGSANTTSTSTTVITASDWAYCAMRFDPSTELAVFLGFQGGNEGALEKVVNTTSIPASIFNSSAAFSLGVLNAGTTPSNHTACKISQTILIASAVPDEILNQHYTQVRALYDT